VLTMTQWYDRKSMSVLKTDDYHSMAFPPCVH